MVLSFVTGQICSVIVPLWQHDVFRSSFAQKWPLDHGRHWRLDQCRQGASIERLWRVRARLVAVEIATFLGILRISGFVNLPEDPLFSYFLIYWAKTNGKPGLVLKVFARRSRVFHLITVAETFFIGGMDDNQPGFSIWPVFTAV